MFMLGLRMEELIVILIIILVLFGGKKLPELSRSVGQAIRELKKGFTEDSSGKSKSEKRKKE